MTKFKTLLLSACVAIAILIPLALYLNQEQAQTTDTNGTISFFGESKNGQPGSHICTLAFVTAKYIFNQMSECINDDAYYFQLNNVPSATTFGLYDDEECEENESQNFYFVMKTMKHNLTMEDRVLIENLIQYPTGQIVPGAPGVRLEKKFADEKISGKLTCVKITRSEIPN